MQLLDIIDTIGSPITHMTISNNDTFIVVACDNKTVQVKSLVTGSDIHSLEGHSSEITCLTISNNSLYCYVACCNGSIYVYNLLSRILLQTFKQHHSSVHDLYISSDDSFLLSACEVFNCFLKKKKTYRTKQRFVVYF